MADFLLSVGVDVGLSYDQMSKDISDLVTLLNQNPQRVRVGLEIDHSAIERFRTEVANIHNSMGGLGRVTVSPVDTGGLNNAIDGIARLAQSTQGAISTVQTMRAELNSVNSERIQQAIASINGISAEGASALAHSLGEANVRATEVRARLLEAADAEQQLVALQVRGTNEAGHMVNYLMTYNTETGEISRKMVDITARLEDATSAESTRATTVREITDLYRQMHALMRTNANASDTASYAELANQAQLLRDALALARTESISIDEALTRLGTSGATAIGGARDAMSAFRLEMEQTGSSGTVNLTTMYDTVAQMQNLLNNNAGYANLTTYTNLQTQVNLLAQAIELASNGGTTLEAALTAVGLNGSTAVHNAREAMSAFRAEMSGATAEEERLTMGTAHYQTALDKINTLLRQVRANTEKWSAAKTGKSSADYQIYADQARELENLAQRLSTGTITMREFNAEYSRIRSTASGAETSIKAAGEATQTWTQRVGKLTEKFGTWFSITRVIMAAYRAVRQMVSAVVDLDTAMTELKKVTDESDARYNQFLENAAVRAKRLGASLTDVVNTSADFARLGLSLEDAEAVSDAALVYKNVGDGITDIDHASESLISTMQAFGVEAEDVMSIVDKFNVTGNNFAISSGGVGDALLNSAAALKAAGNTLDESIGLITAANTTIQNPDKVGTALKTISMYLRAAKTEAEEAGESTEGMAESVSELRDELLSLTGGRVDIQIDDDRFKSTYQILKELSAVWEDLSDVSRANITELIGGKRNANVISAMLKDFEIAEEVITRTAKSSGSALKENAKVLESIQGKINVFKATFQELSKNLIGSDLVKAVVDIGTWIMTALNWIAKAVNALGGMRTVLLGVASVLMVTKAAWIAHMLAVIKNFVVTKFTSIIHGVIDVFKSIPTILSAATTAWKAYAAGTVSASAAMQASIPVIGLVLAALTALSAGVALFSSNADNAIDDSIEEANAAATLSNEISILTNKYLELSSAVATNDSSKEQLMQTQTDLLKKLGLEESQLDNLIKKYGSYSDAIKQATINKLRETELSLRGDILDSQSNLLEAAKVQKEIKWLPHGGIIPVRPQRVTKDNMTSIYSYVAGLNEPGSEVYKAVQALKNDSRFDVSSSSSIFDFSMNNYSDDDLGTIEGIIGAYDELGDALDLVSEKAGSNNEVYGLLHNQYSTIGAAVTDYQNSIGALNANLAEQYILNGLIGKELPTTKLEFDAYRQSVIDAAKNSGEFIGTEKDVSVAIDNVLSQQPQFMKFYEYLIEETDNITNSTKKFVSALSSVESLSSGLDQLDKIYADISDKGSFDWSSILNNEAFTNAFSGLGDAYTDFIETVANSPTDLNACQEAFNNLASAYIMNSRALKGVTDETRDATVAMLEQMGIANAAAIVDAQLAYNKEHLKYTTGDYATKTYEEIVALYNECEAGSVTQQVLAELAIAKMMANENAIQTASDIDQLIALANSANATTQSLANLAKAKEMFTRAESLYAKSETTRQNYIKNGNQADGKEWQRLFAEASSLRLKAEELLKAPLDYNVIDADEFKIKYTGSPSTNSANSSAAKAAKDQETWFDKQLAKHQHLVAMEQETEAEYLAWLSKAYPQAYKEGIIELKDFYKYQEEVFEKLRGLFKDKLGDIEHEISMRENYDGEEKKIISLYQGLIKDVEKEIAKARAQGLTDTDDYIQELQKKWQDYTDAIKDIREEIEESAKDAIDDLIDYRTDMIKQDIENEKDALDKKLDYLKEFYDKQKEMLQDQYDEEKYLEEQAEKRKSVSDLRAEIAMLDKDDSAWAQKRKLELQEELATAEDDLGNFEDEHALDLALDALDNAYDTQQAQIEAEMTALEEKLNDPEALFNQALNDIKNNTGNLYQEMLEYNRKHGTGNDEDVKDIYEEAYKALLEYKDIYGKDYEGIVLTNSTNYKPETGSWDTEKISGANSSLQQTSPPSSTKKPSTSSTPTLTDSIKKHIAAAIWNGNYGWGNGSTRESRLTEVFGKNNGIQAIVNKGYGYVSGISPSGYSYADMRKKFKGYASGTRKASPGIHAVDELGAEYLFTSSDGSRYRVFSGGEKVLNANATDFLYKFANSGGEILEKIIKSVFGTSLFDGIKPAVVHNDITVGGVTVHGSADSKTVSEIRRAQRDNLTEMLKSLNKLNK